MPRRLPTTYARLTPERRAELEAEFRLREMEVDPSSSAADACPSSSAADAGVSAPDEVGIDGGRSEVSLPEPMTVEQVLEPFLAEHYAAEQQLKSEAADRALMGQFSADPVLLDEQFAVEQQIAEEADSGSDSDSEFSALDEDEEEEDLDGEEEDYSDSDFDFTPGEEDDDMEEEDDDMEEKDDDIEEEVCGSGSAPSATDACATVTDGPSTAGSVDVVVISDDDE